MESWSVSHATSTFWATANYFGIVCAAHCTRRTTAWSGTHPAERVNQSRHVAQHVLQPFIKPSATHGLGSVNQTSATYISCLLRASLTAEPAVWRAAGLPHLRGTGSRRHPSATTLSAHIFQFKPTPARLGIYEFKLLALVYPI